VGASASAGAPVSEPPPRWNAGAVDLLLAIDEECAARERAGEGEGEGAGAGAGGAIARDDDEEDAALRPFPPFSAATGARTLIRATAMLLRGGTGGADSGAGDLLMLGGDSGGWALRDLEGLRSDESGYGGGGGAAASTLPPTPPLPPSPAPAPATLRVHLQLDALLSAAPGAGAVRHAYRALGGAVVVPVAVPALRLAVFLDGAGPVEGAGGGAGAAAAAAASISASASASFASAPLLPEPVAAAFARWERRAVALAGWRVAALGATPFLGASSARAKLRLINARR
jgi:hypothetical protein